MADPRPTILSQTMMTKAFADPNFFQAVPEFTPMKARLKAMHIEYDKPGGCGGCKQRRVQQNVYGDFSAQVQALPPEALARFKQYLGVPLLMVNNVEPRTNKITVRVF